jgi:hypothetical protein
MGLIGATRLNSSSVQELGRYVTRMNADIVFLHFRYLVC